MAAALINRYCGACRVKEPTNQRAVEGDTESERETESTERGSRWCTMLESQDLEILRRKNKALLERLKGKQEEFRHHVPVQSARGPPSSLSHVSGPDRETTTRAFVANGGNRQTLSTEEDGTGLVRLVPYGESAAVARLALCSPQKSVRKMHEPWTARDYKDRGGKLVASQPKAHRTDESCSYRAHIASGKPSVREPRPLSLVKQDRLGMRTEEETRQSVESEARSTIRTALTSSGGDRLQLEPEKYAARLLDDGNNRQREEVLQEIHKPKSILNLSHSYNTKKDAGHVTFESGAESSWTVRPLLGYDWIAGLLEIDSSVAEKSEQYFSELHEFRRVNQEECVHARYYESQTPDSMSLDDDSKDLSLGPHQCVFCYRVNKRLFPVSLGPESACPVCKSCRSKQPASIEEPAYVRVSIPRSTLLPPHKYKAHRRRSFDPSDSLALPSHCLAGWENTVPSSELPVPSLDLRTSVEPKAVECTTLSNLDLVSRVSGSARSDHLLNLSRSAYFQLNKSMRSGVLAALDSS